MKARADRTQPFTLSQGLLHEGWEDSVVEVLSRRLLELRRRSQEPWSAPDSDRQPGPAGDTPRRAGPGA